MDLARFWRHVRMTPAAARRAFPDATLEAIGREVAAHERRHRGEVVLVVEAELSTAQLLRGMSPRERAKEVFAQQGVWNTEENTGVLFYVLLADHRVEIVADRGIDAKVAPREWQEIVDRVDALFRERRYEAGGIEGVRGISALLERHFPASGERRNELPDRPVRL